MDEESLIKKALKALNTEECRAITYAAQKYGVAYNTLRARYRKETTTRLRAHESQMALNLAQERAVIQWIGGLTIKGFSPTYTLLHSRIEAVRYAENLEDPPLGKNYLTKLIKRHPELGVAFANRRDKKRVLANPRVV